MARFELWGPRCDDELVHEPCGWFVAFTCSRCGGLAITVNALRKVADAKRVIRTWRAVPENGLPGNRPCPDCRRPMTTFDVQTERGTVPLDACRGCLVVWFDEGELDAYRQGDTGPPEPNELRTPTPTPTPALDRALRRRQRPVAMPYGGLGSYEGSFLARVAATWWAGWLRH